VIKCAHCGNQVVPVKPRLSLFWLLFWLIMGLLPGVIYYFYNRSKPAVKCPVCGKNAYK
jgi:DNA-directed RNA polymerase subunit RPC12/RpoP